jgi:non-specific serine/threonine protein kinase
MPSNDPSAGSSATKKSAREVSMVREWFPIASIPVPLTPMIGRERELAAASSLIQGDVRLLTFTGTAGIGKTRLAIALAAELGASFRDGAVFVPLASAREPGLVLTAVADALAIRDEGTVPLLTRLIAVLQDQQLLLVLDNFEQVADAASDISTLLESCPKLRAVVTSRVRLRVRGEHPLPVPPLPVPDPARLPPLDRLQRNPAVSLFVARGADIDPGFALGPDNAAAIATICARLEGLPLAIELAAARLEILSPRALAARLDGRLTVLTRGARDAAERHRTLRDAIDWSYELLTPEEQRLLRGLAVFAGGCDAAAAEAVIGPLGANAAPDVLLNGLGKLIDHSLVQREIVAGEPRFRLLESIREYGLEQSIAEGEAEATRRRHADYFLALTSILGTSLDTDRETHFDQLELEHDNIRAALTWAIGNDPAMALRLASALWRFWDVRGHLSEGRSWFARALAVEGPVPAGIRATALQWASHLAFLQANYDHAARLAEESLSIWPAGEDDSGKGRAICALGNIASAQQDFAAAERFYEEAIAIERACGNQAEVAGMLGNLGLVAGFKGDLTRAESLFEEAIALSEAAGHERNAATFHVALGDLLRDEGDGSRAARHFGKALRWFQRIGETSAGTLECWEGLAGIAVRTDPVRAARLLGAAEALRERVGHPLEPALQPRYDVTLDLVRSTLASAVLAAAWDAGRRLSVEQATTEALSIAGGSSPPDDGPRRRSATDSHGLTPREMDVLRLLAAGHSDREIADTLFISRHTAMVHAKNIRRKLGVDSRAAIASYAVRVGLV